MRAEYLDGGAETRVGTAAEKDDVLTGRQRTEYLHYCAECWGRKLTPEEVATPDRPALARGWRLRSGATCLEVTRKPKALHSA